MVPKNQRQEALSRAYVRAVAAQAGVLCGRPEDDFGLDLFLRSVVTGQHQYRDAGTQIDLQLKSTTSAEVRDTEVIYDLEARAYELLREPVSLPRLLVLLVLPEHEAGWLDQSEDGLLLRRCAYWLSLLGAAPTANRTTVRVRIPRAHVFSVQAVHDLLNRASQRLPL